MAVRGQTAPQWQDLLPLEVKNLALGGDFDKKESVRGQKVPPNAKVLTRKYCKYSRQGVSCPLTADQVMIFYY